MAERGPWDRYQDQDDGPWQKYAQPKLPLLSPEFDEQLRQQSQHFIEDYPDDSIAVPGDERRITPERMHRLQGLGGSYHEISGDYSRFRDPDPRYRRGSSRTFPPRHSGGEQLGSDRQTRELRGSTDGAAAGERDPRIYDYPLPGSGYPYAPSSGLPEGIPGVPLTSDQKTIPRGWIGPRPNDQSGPRPWPLPGRFDPGPNIRETTGFLPEGPPRPKSGTMYSNISGDARSLVDPIIQRRVRTEPATKDSETGTSPSQFLPVPSSATTAEGTHPADRYATPAGVPPGAAGHPADKYAERRSPRLGGRNLRAPDTPDDPFYGAKPAYEAAWDRAKAGAAQMEEGAEQLWPQSEANRRAVEAGHPGIGAANVGLGALGAATAPYAGAASAVSGLSQGRVSPQTAEDVIGLAAWAPVVGAAGRAGVAARDAALLKDLPGIAPGEIASSIPDIPPRGAERPLEHAPVDSEPHPADKYAQPLEGEVYGPNEPVGDPEGRFEWDKAEEEHQAEMARERFREAGGGIPQLQRDDPGTINQSGRPIGGYTEEEEAAWREVEKWANEPDEPNLRLKGRREISPSVLERVEELKWRAPDWNTLQAQKAARRKELFKDWPDERLHDYIRNYTEQMRTAGPEGQRLLRSHIDQYKDELAAREDRVAAGDIAEHATQPEATVDRQLSPQSVGAAAIVPQTKMQAASMASGGHVDRFVMRQLEGVFHKQKGADGAAKGRLIQWLKPFGGRGKPVGSPMDEAAYLHLEGDPSAPATPESLAIAQEPELQHFRQQNQELYLEGTRLAKGDTAMQQALADLNPNYVHRATIQGIQRILGEGEDPVTATPLQMKGIHEPDPVKDRFYFALENDRGVRLPGVVYLKDGDIYQVEQTYAAGQQPQLLKSKIKVPPTFDGKKLNAGLPKDFVAKRGARFRYKGQNVRIVDAHTRAIEDATAGTPSEIKYAKSAYASTGIANLQLNKYVNALRARNEFVGELKKRGLFASLEGPRPTTKGFAGGFKANWERSEIPGAQDQWVHPRVQAIYRRYMVAAKKSGLEDPLELLNGANHAMVSTLFLNPFVHGFNVAAHAAIERGFRWLNPSADVKMMRNLWQAFHDVRKGSPAYFENMEQGARLMWREARANRLLLNKMFRGIKEIQDAPQNQQLLHKLYQHTGMKARDLLRTVYGASSDALWFMGDVLTQASIYERRMYQGRSFHVGKPWETHAESIRAIHKEIPSYRIPTEEMFPGKPGRMASNTLRHPAFQATAGTFVNYHENILRSYSSAIDDIFQGINHMTDAKARTEAYNAVGKLFATYVALYAMSGADQFAPDDMMARRFGPLALIQSIVDLFQDRHFSLGAKTKLYTGGIFSPSPAAELGANIFGYHAYSMSPIYGAKGEKKPMRGQDVPWQRRAETALTTPFWPAQQFESALIEGPKAPGYYLGLEQFRRKPESAYRRY